MFLHEPRPQDIHAILHRYLHKLHCAPDLDTTPAVQALSTACASASEVECFVRNAFMHALREKVHAIEGKRSHTETESVSAAGTGKKSAAVSLGVGGTAERGVILQKHINQALKDLAPTDTLQVQERSVGIINSSSSSSSAGFSWSGEFSIGNN